MTKTCLRDNRPFGVCLIREGREVGDPALPEVIGTALATIEEWDMPQMGLFQLLARGGDRFRLVDSRVAKNGLYPALSSVSPRIRREMRSMRPVARSSSSSCSGRM